MRIKKSSLDFQNDNQQCIDNSEPQPKNEKKRMSSIFYGYVHTDKEED